MLDGAARLDGPVRRGRADGDARGRDRPTTATCTARYDFYKQAKQPASSRSSASRPTSTPGVPAATSSGSSGASRKSDDVSGGGAYTHMTMLGRRRPTGLHNLFRLASRRQPRGPLHKPRMDRELLAELRRRADRDDRLPVRRGADPAAPGPVRRGAAGRRRLPGHLRQGQLLLRADGPRPRDRAPGPHGPARHRAASSACRSSRPTTRTTPTSRGRAGARRAAVRADRQDARRPGPLPVRRRRLLPQERRRDARIDWRELPGGVRQHPAHRRAVRRVVHRGRGPATCRGSPSPRARPRSPGSSRRSRPGLHRRYPGGVPDDGAQAGRVRDRGHHPDGVPRLLPRRRRLHHLGQGATASRSARAVAPAPARCARTRWASPTSTRSSTA